VAEERANKPESGQSVAAWLGFWIQLAVLCLLAVLGAWFASAARGSGDYDCGLILTLCALALAFLRLKARFDTDAANWQEFLLVDTPANLVIVVPLFAAIALGGLFLAAAWGEGSLHDSGIALFAASGIAVFLSLKRVFDTLDRR
jgi:hypothetical protein